MLGSSFGSHDGWRLCNCGHPARVLTCSHTPPGGSACADLGVHPQGEGALSAHPNKPLQAKRNQLLPGGTTPRAHVLVAGGVIISEGITRVLPRSGSRWGTEGTVKVGWNSALLSRVRKRDPPCSIGALPQLRHAQSRQRDSCQMGPREVGANICYAIRDYAGLLSSS